ncbi:MAG: hypothetical protein J5I90_20375 [Caldilineales bacterium]|nr:hypothetical protein [Caldilineales bacterium]
MTTVTLDIPESVVPLLDMTGDQLSLVIELGVSRLAPVSSRAYSETILFLTQAPSAEEIVKFRFSLGVEESINSLLNKSHVGRLSPAEEVELVRLVELKEQLQLLKTKMSARQRSGD